jgi:hypothetical protein
MSASITACTKSSEHGYASKAQARADGDAGLPPYQKVRVQDDAKQEEGQPAVEDHNNSMQDNIFLIRRSHSTSFTRAQGIPKFMMGFGRGKGWESWGKIEGS